LAPYYLKGMDPMRELIAPEIVQAIIARATAHGLSVNDYLRLALGLTHGVQPNELAPPAPPEQAPSPRNERMLEALRESAEILKDLPVSGSTEETLKIIREGRAGAMWGYDVRHEGGGKE
jgi:hypothetical protein